MLQRLFVVVVVAFLALPSLADDKLPDTQELLKQAQSGDAKAQFLLGAAHDYGRGVPKNAAEAAKWYRAAADQGYAHAQNSLGSSLQAEKKFSEALPWFEKASAQGHALATNNLAYLYDLGLGVPQDRRKGFDLYSKAADLGWPEAMWNLAQMYGAGQVGKPDMVMACVWMFRARRYATGADGQLLSQAARLIPRVERMLSAENLASCKEQGENWKPSQIATREPS